MQLVRLLRLVILRQCSGSKRTRPAVYVLLCNDGSLYTGATVDLERRLEAHRRKRGAKYTRGRLPVTLIAWWYPATYAVGKSHEARFKRLRRAEKLAALAGAEVYGCPIQRERKGQPAKR